MRQSVPTHPPAVGDRIEVYWRDDKKYYAGVVHELRPNDSFFILYDDGDEETLMLAKERWRFAGGSTGGASSSAASAGSTDAKPTRRPKTPPSKRYSGASVGGPSKRARKESEVTPAPATLEGAKTPTEVEEAAPSSADTKSDEKQGATATQKADKALSVSPVTIDGVANVVTNIIAKEAEEWTRRNLALQKKLQDVEEKLAEASSEISALRGQLAALRAVSPPQATAARNAVRSVVREMALALVADDGPLNTR